ncbi:uncharacterized protein LOC113349142 [Papaver somniferum]|uniref:uncharacterized protein LOC113349142 n=1 Tax=Papaver somniferum TaxID=3469 RepID=UPI000E6F6DD9|nr:uncharacterized protein LOC113349142 [Papaver somniferum]
MAISNNNNSSSSPDEDSKASAANSKAKRTHDKGEKPSISPNNQRVTYAEHMKRKAETDEVEGRMRRKDRIQRKILAAEERRRFVDGVPSDSDADASEEETTWVLQEFKVKPMKRVDAELEAEAEEDSDSDDPHTHPDFINGLDSDSDEEEDSEKDSDDESDSSDESDE